MRLILERWDKSPNLDNKPLNPLLDDSKGKERRTQTMLKYMYLYQSYKTRFKSKVCTEPMLFPLFVSLLPSMLVAAACSHAPCPIPSKNSPRGICWYICRLADLRTNAHDPCLSQSSIDVSVTI